MVLLITIGVFSSCKKAEDYDAVKQMAIDDALITEFISKNSIPAIKHESGVYYQIISPGSGNTSYTGNSQVTVSYEGRFLSGTVFQKAAPTNPFYLGQLIPGWQIGIPLIQKGGKIRLIIPSPLAYQNQANNGIPENSILDFTIELINVQ